LWLIVFLNINIIIPVEIPEENIFIILDNAGPSSKKIENH